MTRLAWDAPGERRYENGVDRGVLYRVDNGGNYNIGYAWNGLTGITESPSGADSNPQYADNIKYVDIRSAEDFGGTIEAFTYPDAWAECDGSAMPQAGVRVGQQGRKPFGLSYRTKVGNDTSGGDYGYKLHMVWGATASPSERAFSTVNDSPEAVGFSWEFSCAPLQVAGYKPVASLEIDSTKVDATALTNLENLLYGTAGVEPQLPSPTDVLALFAGTVTAVTPTAPTYNSSTHVVTIPAVTGVVYKINGVAVTGTRTITGNTVVTASPATGYVFSADADNDWSITY